MSNPKHTALHAEHVAAGGKMVPFAGYELPIQYPSGITAEHNAVRNSAGLFDVSHMGEFIITGPGAIDFVQYLTTNDVTDLEVGQAQYSTLPREDGNLLDDLLIYRYPDHIMMVVNAANRTKDLNWVLRWKDRFDVEVEDRSDDISLLALQGPAAASILAPLTATDLDSIGYYRFTEGEVAGHAATISRTGYTGEDGFELYLANDAAVPVWRAILGQGDDRLVIPAGLGSRDSLRLEVGYALYGNDLDEDRNPLEAGLAWVTKLDTDFIGRDALVRIKEKGVREKLIGFRMLERGFPRPGYELRHEGATVGTVTSGTVSPSLGVGLGMGYVPIELAKPGTRLEVMVRNQGIPAEVVRPPFYTDGSIKR